ncbi:hypothetical protein EMO91_10655 [Bifidobacterium myosotis]|uniref:Uncharacterized protein n=2 Tax=Bifidobacterium myosotis TaxID=1630166 RepID=A0A5M9ZHE3_9BIFI|nr:hypothetical protein EMO91_10655 [Bifidobacterium myosotis]
MKNITDLTYGQALALGSILDGLRPRGFDADGLGVYSPNLHVEAAGGGRVNWWLDGDDGFANGSLDRRGHGLWWLRRAYGPNLHRV